MHLKYLEKIEAQRVELNRLYNKVEGYEKALAAIKRVAGVVCNQYEICTHGSCTASHAAWTIADAALRGRQLDEEDKDQGG